ncbi:hypothetical protein [Myxococcus qinghaiensis]|uniref:hypothetical protein n=1 Tax=Myxococcus qinghaiensis TaxID=2906758 RepID=UPI0020A70D1A|nr:hypothetical protein [Myxococcus qinghaiensis]MCP3169301.1 hypothetical protein [Myxococcus qinghaiensis]
MRAGILICLCLGLSAVASAEWKEGLTVPGEPRDVRAWEPFTVAIAHSTGAELHVNEEQRANRNLSPAVGTLLLTSGCFAGVRNDGVIFAFDNCLPGGSIIPDLPTATTTEVRRVMQTASGTGYAAIAVDTNDILLLHATASETATFPWPTRVLETSEYRATSVMGVTESAGGVSHAVVPVIGPQNLLYIRADKREASFSMNTALTTQPLQTVDLIPTSGLFPILLAGNADGLFRAPLSAAPVPGDFSRVTLVDSGPVNIVSVDVNTEQSTGRGTGFGLAVGTRNGGEHVVLGAVPTGSASDSGMTWRVHPAFANASLPVSDPFDQVSCVDSSFCVITLRNQGQNVIYYVNAVAPVFGAIPDPVLIDEGTTRTLEVTASDEDGDAVRVSADVGATPLTVNATPGMDAVSLSLTAPEVCETTTTQFTVFASDGLGAHDRQTPVTVRIENTEGPGAPGVLPLQGTTSAGGSSLVFTASPSAGVCESVDYVWSTPPGQPMLQTEEAGRIATFTPPEFLCSATGARYTYEVRARDKGRIPSEATAISVDVQPWGKPAAPFALNTVRQVRSGSTVELRPEALHACEATAGLPQVDTVWRLPDGGSVPPGLSVKDGAGTPVDLSSPVTAQVLQVSAEGCGLASLTLVVRNRMTVDGVGVVEGPEVPVRVDAQPEAEDVSAASLDLSMSVTGGGQDVEATLGTSLRCPGAYALKARMFLESADGVQLASQVVPVPGVWRFQLPAVCSPTAYTVRGELFSDVATPVEAGRARQTLTAEARAVSLGEVEGEALVARCGEGAKTTLTQRIPPDACTDVDVSWSRESGPALAQDDLSGPSVTVATRETGLQELVGTSLSLRVTADAGGGNAATRVHTVPIVADPFVEVAHSTEASSGQETGLVGVVVQLSNTTDCGVTGLRYVERVEGMELVPGSVKVAGATLAEQSTEGGFQVEGVALAAHETRTLTYVVRPRLLSSPRFAGEVFLNGVPVSGASSSEQPSSCGCSQGGSGAALFGLLAVAQWLRRRRDGTRR